MKKCYKCQKVYVEPNGPGFQDVCENCGSYLHCCQNCYFYDPYQHNSCTEPQAEFVSDSNGMNRCEYFRFKVMGGLKRRDDEEDEGRRFRKPDWRNLKKDEPRPPRRREGMVDDGRGGGDRRDNLFQRREGGSSEERAQKAREALDKLFRKD